LVGRKVPESLDAKYAVVPEGTRILKKATADPQPVRVDISKKGWIKKKEESKKSVIKYKNKKN